MLNTFDKTNLREIRNDINAALAEVAKKHGIELNLGTITFSAFEARCKLSMAQTTKVTSATTNPTFNTATASAPLPVALQRACTVHNLVATKRGPKGEKLVDYVASRYKYPFTYETVRGTRYKASIADAVRMFGA